MRCEIHSHQVAILAETCLFDATYGFCTWMAERVCPDGGALLLWVRLPAPCNDEVMLPCCCRAVACCCSGAANADCCWGPTPPPDPPAGTKECDCEALGGWP